MSTSPPPGLPELAAALAELAARVDRLGAQLDAPSEQPEAVVDAVVEGLSRAPEELEALARQARSASAALAAQRADLVHERAFGEARWMQREAAWRVSLAAADEGAVRAWWRAWARALLAGETGECDRLEALAAELLPARAWLVDRCRCGRAGLAARSFARVAPLVDLASTFAVDLETFEIVLSVRDVVARVAVVGGASPDGALVAPWYEGDPGEGAAAARAFLARHALPDDAPPDAVDAVVQLAGEAAAVGTLAGVAEAVHAEARRPGATFDDALDRARPAVDRLATLVGVEGVLDLLVEAPPAALLLALGERALREGRFDVAEALARRADNTGDAATDAAVAALRVDVARARGDAPADLAALVVAAGDAAAWARQPDVAIARYREALRLQPEQVDAAYGLADALLISSWSTPTGDARDRLEESLSLIAAARGRAGVDTEHAWTFLTESQAHGRLSALAEPERAVHVWETLGAACRGLALAPEEPRFWSQLGRALNDANAYHAECVATERAEALAPDDPSAREQHLIALANAGRLDEAAQRAGSSTSWDHLVRAFIRRGQGDPAGALAETDAALATSDPSFDEPWYHHQRAELLRSLGRDDEARPEWVWLWEHARFDDVGRLAQAANAAEALGLTTDAAGLADRMAAVEDASVAEGTSAALRGVVRLQQGDGDGVADLEQSASARLSGRSLDELGDLVEQTVGRLDPVPPGLERVRATIARRRAVLATLTADDLVRAELAAIRPPAGDGEGLATATAAAVEGWVRCAWGDADGASACWSRAAAHPAFAHPVPTCPPVPGAAAVGPPEAGSAADAREAGAEPAAPEAEPAPAPLPAVVTLPPSWFAGMADPLHEHDLFVRFIPDERERLARDGRTLPGIHVSDDAALEPGGVRFGGTDLEPLAFTVDPARWACADAWLVDLPEAARATAVPLEGRPGWSLVEAPAVGDRRTVLVAWSPAEQVAHRLGDALH